MSGPPTAGAHYTLPNAWGRAQQRLALLGEAFDPKSIALARDLGVGPGWRCLEAGAGGGSFARWLCAATAPGGRVLAVDADPRHLRDLPRLGGEVAQLDLVADDLPEHAFDFVHTRVVLIHITQRDLVLEKLARAVAPGGLLVLEEDDALGAPEQMTDAYGQVWQCFRRMSESAGLNAMWARDLPARLQGLGFHDLTANAEIAFFAGGSTLARFWSLTWVQVHDRLLAHGATADLIGAAHVELEDPRRWFRGPATVRVCGRAAE